MISFLLKKIVGSQNERELKKLSSTIVKINDLEKEFYKIHNTELLEKANNLKNDLRSSLNGNFDISSEDNSSDLESALWEILPEAFALVREASRRTIGMRHFDVQLIGGIVLHQGKIAEMKTGEGKTLAAVLSLFLNGLSGFAAHLVTVNDYLAGRDAIWMGPIYKLLGQEVGVINHEVSYKVEWEKPHRAEKAIENNYTVWPNEYIDLDIPPERNLEVLSSFKTKLVECPRKDAYGADVTYGTNNEYGFDYLRDNMKFSLDDYVQREHNFAIVDEVDSILIDEARTPLIISGPSESSTEQYYNIDKTVRRLKKDIDFTIDEKTRQVTPTEEGASKVENALGIKNLYDPINLEILHHVIQGLKAHSLFKLDVDYMVKDGKVIIVDEFTGRLMPGRRWSDGLHQAVEAKEGVEIENENQTLATITIQNYFRLYRKLSGMTGTADTEAFEFKNIYKLDVSVIPTHKPMIRLDGNDLIYKSENEKFNAVIDEIKELNNLGRPILVGTTSIEKSEKISNLLQKLKLKHQVLNAKNHQQEASIIAQAGRISSITIATNMAGRGTDILLGGNPEFLARDIIKKNYHIEPEEADQEQFESAMLDARSICKDEKKRVLELGGSHIIGTERHESRRIDNQLRGRSGRQGDPGSSTFFVSLQDDLMRIFASERISSIMDKLGWEEGEPIEHKMITKSIENAQKKVEGRNFDIRKHLLEYDDVLNKQREVVYKKRKEYLAGGEDLKDIFFNIADEVIDELLESNLPEKIKVDELDLAPFQDSVSTIFNLQDIFKDLSSNGTGREQIDNHVRDRIHDYYEEKEKDIGNDTMRQIERFVMLQTLDYLWKDHLLNMDHLREGVGLRGYAQLDPLNEYKREGFDMFSEMMVSCSENICEKLFRVQPVSDTEIEQLERKRRQEQQRMTLSGGGDGSAEQQKPKPVRREKKIGRNDPCPCGSGKKYKKCHGRNA